MIIIDEYNYISCKSDFIHYYFFIYLMHKNKCKKISKNKYKIDKDTLLTLKKYFIIKNHKKSLFKFEMYKYQKEATNFIIHNPASLLVLPCGAGKSFILIGTYAILKDKNIVNTPGLIIVKASLKEQWYNEVYKMTYGLTANIISTYSECNSSIINKINRLKKNIEKLDKKDKQIKENKKKIRELKKQADEKFYKQFDGYDLFILNYETLNDEKVNKYLCDMQLEFVASDESQYIKSHTRKRSKSACKIARTCKKYRIASTATPIQKDPTDIFSIFKFVKDDLFKNYRNFCNAYIKYSGNIPIGKTNYHILNSKIKPYMFIKTKEEVSNQLPKLNVIPIYVSMTPIQRDAYTKVMDKMDSLSDQEAKLKSIKNKTEETENTLLKISNFKMALMQFAQEITNCPLLLKYSDSNFSKQFLVNDLGGKIPILIELLEQIIDSGEKVAIFSKFAKFKYILSNILKEKYPKAKIAYVTGDLSSEERYNQVYNLFQNKDEYKVLFLTEAGNAGLNLSKCKYLIEIELADSYTNQTQRHGRIERSDSIFDNVFIYQILCKDSYDDIQKRIIAKKKEYDTQIIKK